ncbi:sugar kinase [Halobacillus salinarum]|uniref:Sugar kinase n=1 Tax=Halobacillus salinarum TaxID=2932257 RepID=A0ABY4ES71_9BACI|nr:sugar kinase [Halobacillus salinarum]UOQ44981.1 sugar kinase [Halobacillus salinarum]
MEKLDVVTFGEAMAMFYAEETGPLHRVSRFIRELAGAETNFAIGMAKLGFRSGWVSKVGNDAFGKFVMERLQEEGVNVEHVLASSEHPTGFQLKSKVFEGDPEVQYFRKGSAASRLKTEDFNEGYFKKADHLHMTGIPLAVSSSVRAFAEHTLDFMKKEGKTVSFDPNLRPSLWNTEQEMTAVTNEAAAKADVLLPGIEEGQVLTGCSTPEEIAAFYIDLGVQLVVVKLGEEGAYYQTKTDRGYVQGIKVAHVVDTVGAGDGFAVGLVSGLLEQREIKDAVFRGNAIGALAVQSPGDNDGYPDKNSLEDFMNTHLKGAK